MLNKNSSVFKNCHGSQISDFHSVSKSNSALTLLPNMPLENSAQTPIPPVAKKIDKTLEIHGDKRNDPYYWLNERENPDVISYLQAENQYTDAILGHTKDFQKALYDEMVGRIKLTDESVPYFSNGYWYYTRFEDKKEYPIYCRRKDSMESPELIMLDVNVLAEGHSFMDVGGLSVSEDNTTLAFGTDTLSRRIYTIHFKNLITGEMLPDTIENTTGSCCWAADNKTVFYSVKDPQTLRSCYIYKRRLTEQESSLVYFEEDVTFNTYVYKSKSKKYIIIGSDSTLTSEYRLLESSNSDGNFRIFQERKRGIEYGIAHFNNTFYVVTNYEATNFRLMQTPETATGIENWKEVIAHRNDTLLEGLELFNGYMVIDERRDGLTHLRIIDLNQNTEHYLDFGESAYSAGVSVNPDFDSQWLRFSYTSLTTPNSTFDYNMVTREKKLLKQQEVVGGYNSEDYQSERIYVKARDGKSIPLSLVYKKSLTPNPQKPLLLYGYGSYGATMDVYFSSVRISLLDRGFTFAIAHIRGGQELGRNWYEDGKLLNKKNTFYDFIDCANYLIEAKYTSEQHLYAMGGSAGGLLMGAVINMAPEVFNGVVAQVPFVDVVTTMLDDSIPLTTGEYDEWGNPNDKQFYDYIKSYSPYDNIESKAYPAMLVTTGLHDSQVQYWEPAKWVARLRELKTDNNILLLQTNLEAGHGGASGRFERIKEIALEYAFLLHLEGIYN
jgi:oligopeptidase B